MEPVRHEAMNSKTSSKAEDYLKSLEQDIEGFEKQERSRLAITETSVEQWHDENPTEFTAQQREHTTILHAGLTMAHDLFIQSAFRGMGYKVAAMEVPDNRALQFGREFGNRGQCNPTYFTVGNLIKKLKAMNAEGISKEDIVKNYIFATAGACGPCRFGTYVTEYRKALRDAGFNGFRVILFQQTGGVKQATGQELGLKIDVSFFLGMTKAILLGDALNALMYRIRPYELTAGETDAAIARAKERIAQAFETRKGLFRALWKTRRELAAIKVDRTQVKPRVAIIGEFWAMTTEGDGNYKMQHFLEEEGAEVDIQLVTNWVLFLLWSSRHDTEQRAQLKGVDKRMEHSSGGSKFALENVHVAKKLMGIRAAEWFLRGVFHSYAKILGLRQYHLPDMDHIAEISHAFYDNNIRGGEGHMEVGKLIHNVVDQKVNMTLSIKPFGCMPSGAVSDGVQSLITELYPTAIFLPIETNGDGAVNVYSRVQMQLFKAKKAANREVDELLEEVGWSADDFAKKVQERKALQSATYYSAHAGGCTTVDLLSDVIERDKGVAKRLGAQMKSWWRRAKSHKKHSLDSVEVAAQRFKESRQASSANKEVAVKFVDP